MTGLGDLVGVGTGRQPGPDVEELADSVVAQEPYRAHQELAVGARAVQNLRRDLEGHFGRLPVDGEVVLTAQKVVVDPGWMRDIRADPQCLPSFVPFLLVLPGHRASPHSFAAQMMPDQALDGRTGRKCCRTCWSRNHGSFRSHNGEYRVRCPVARNPVTSASRSPSRWSTSSSPSPWPWSSAIEAERRSQRRSQRRSWPRHISAASEYVGRRRSAPHVPGAPQHSCSPAPAHPAPRINRHDVTSMRL
jgi:hypothetical protein